MDVYIDYESEYFHGVVGPFSDRQAADDWAVEAARGESATWSGQQVLSPARAQVEINRRRLELERT